MYFKDEVTEELKKQKAELVSLYAKTKPIIDQLHGRICKEYAVHEVCRQLDEADYKVHIFTHDNLDNTFSCIKMAPKLSDCTPSTRNNVRKQGLF